MKERPNEWAVILVFLSRGQSFVRPSEDVEEIEMALERKKVPHPCCKAMQIVYRHMHLFCRASSLLFNGLFVQNTLYLFHTRSTANGFLYFRELSAAVGGGLEGKQWRSFHTVSHLRIATRLLYLFYHLSFIQLSLLFLLHSSCSLFFFFPYYSFVPTFHFYLTSCEHRFQQQIWVCNVSFPFLIIEHLRSAPRGTFTNVSASQPLSNTCRDTKCQSLSSVTAFVNCSHLEMSMSKPQWEGANS